MVLSGHGTPAGLRKRTGLFDISFSRRSRVEIFLPCYQMQRSNYPKYSKAANVGAASFLHFEPVKTRFSQTLSAMRFRHP